MSENNISSIVWNNWDKLIDEAYSIFLKEFHTDQNGWLRIVPYRKTIRSLSEESILKFSENTISSIWFQLWIREWEYPIHDKILIDKINNYLKLYVFEHCWVVRRCVNELIW